MPRAFPPPDTLHPVIRPDGTTETTIVYLNAVLDVPGLTIGDYTYYSDRDMPPPDQLLGRLFPYLFGRQQVTIGKLCAIATGTQFITDSANHRYDGISTYPFAIFDGMDPARPSLPPGPPRPTHVGHDCWFGHGAMVMPAANIGHGTIIGAGAVVGGAVPPYSVVVGNPGRIVRSRFDPDTVARLCALAWWDWPIDQILAHEAEICGGDVTALEAASP